MGGIITHLDSRPEPPLPAHKMLTYAIRSPSDQRILAACSQVGCEFWRNGWDSLVDERTTDGQLQARAIRTKSGRTFREMRRGDGITVFRFDPGQRCFRDHYTLPEIYLRRAGDHRGNPTGERYRHRNAAEWVEDFAEHQARFAEEAQRG